MREEEKRQSEEREETSHAAPTRDGVKRFETYRILVRNTESVPRTRNLPRSDLNLFDQLRGSGSAYISWIRRCSSFTAPDSGIVQVQCRALRTTRLGSCQVRPISSKENDNEQ